MTKLVLHIGMQKTGSTAIQRSLAANNGNGFVLPHLGGKPLKPLHRDALMQLFPKSSEQLTNRPIQKGRNLDVVADPVHQIRLAAAKTNTVILSSEGIAKIDLRKFASFARELFDDVVVVGYVREPISLMSAAFWTSIRAYPAAGFNLGRLPYRSYWIFDKIFGRENVQLWRYDKSDFPDGDIVQHFCSRLGLPKLTSENRNETVSRPAVAATYRLNRGLRGGELDAFKCIRTAIVRNFPHGAWPKFRFSPLLLRPLIDDDDVSRMELRIGASLREGFDSQEHDVASEAALSELDEHAYAALRQLRANLKPEELALFDRELGAAKWSDDSCK